MRINIPAPAASIIDVLSSHGYEAFVVGGCVRDSLLGLSPADWDITTDATPEQVKLLFPRTIDTGLKHGTVTVMIDREGYEVTTYRIDGLYEDHRRPNSVTFTRDLREDLGRRDFTINAMAYNHEKGLVDLFGGMQDLEHKIIRCVGDPCERFEEDALRMMRAIRFAGQLHFSIDAETEEAIAKKAPLLANVSAERIRTELVKLLVSDHPDLLKVAWRTGLTAVFLPEFDSMMTTSQDNPHHCYTVGEHTLHALMASKNDPLVRLSLLFHDMGKPETRSTDEQGIDHFYGHDKVSAELAQEIMKRLKFDNQSIHATKILIENHDIRFQDATTAGKKHVRKIMNRIGAPLFPYLLDVMEADISAQSDYMRMHKLMNLKEAREAYREILEAKDCLTLKDLNINGNDLKQMGIREGKLVGAVLQTLLHLVLDHPEYNDHDYLMELAEKIHDELSSCSQAVRGSK